MTAARDKKSVDWVVCQRALEGLRPDRSLTFAEIAVVYQAVLAGGGSHNTVLALLGINHAYLKTVRAHVGDVSGFPVVDGIRLVWCAPDWERTRTVATAR